MNITRKTNTSSDVTLLIGARANNHIVSSNGSDQGAIECTVGDRTDSSALWILKNENRGKPEKQWSGH